VSISVSDTSSSSIGPPSPATSLQDLPPIQVQVRGQEEEPRSKWSISICDPRKWSTGSSRNIAQVGVQSECERRGNMTKHKHLDPKEEEEEEEEEQYLEYDDF
jgi:hypothetical protein